MVNEEQMWIVWATRVSSISLLECGTGSLSSCSKIQSLTLFLPISIILHGENSRELLVA